MSNAFPCRLLAGVILLVATSHHQLLAQSPECPTGKALLSKSDPVYADAMELAKVLQDHGFAVQCVFPTKLGSIFQVVEGGVEHSTIEGEANFRTNYGDIDAVFVPKPQTFADFKITEHREHGGYLYSFTGMPRVWAVNRFGTARRNYFVKHDNELLLMSDDRLRIRIEHALRLPPQSRQPFTSLSDASGRTPETHVSLTTAYNAA